MLPLLAALAAAVLFLNGVITMLIGRRRRRKRRRKRWGLVEADDDIVADAEDGDSADALSTLFDLTWSGMAQTQIMLYRRCML